MMGMTPNAEAISLVRFVVDIPSAAVCSQAMSMLVPMIHKEQHEVAASRREWNSYRLKGVWWCTCSGTCGSVSALLLLPI